MILFGHTKCSYRNLLGCCHRHIDDSIFSCFDFRSRDGKQITLIAILMSGERKKSLLLSIRAAEQSWLELYPLYSAVFLGSLESHDAIDTHRVHLVILCLDE